MELDKQAFAEGYRTHFKQAGIGDWLSKHFSVGGGGMRDSMYNDVADTANKHLGAGGGGLRDNMWNGATDTVGKFIGESSQKAMNHGLKDSVGQLSQHAGQNAVSGVVNGVKDGVGKVTGSIMDYGKGMMSDPMGTAQKNPWMTGGLLAAGAGAGYLGGKALGLWGGNNGNSAPSNGQGSNISSNGQSAPPPPMMQGAYTQGYTPMALNKAGNDLMSLPGLNALNPSLSVGHSMYNAFNPPNVEESNPVKRVIVNPEDERVAKLLQNPRMREYVTNLIKETHT